MKSTTVSSLTLFALLAIPSTLITNNQAIVNPVRVKEINTIITHAINSSCWMIELSGKINKGACNGE